MSIALVLGIATVTAMEFVQVFIASHAATATDLFFSSCGVAIGVSLAGRATDLDPTRAGSMESQFERKALAFVALWIVLLFAFHWAPYDFTLDTEAIRQKLADVSLVPFAGYRNGSYLNALSTLLSKLALSIPLGAGAVLSFAPRVGTS